MKLKVWWEESYETDPRSFPEWENDEGISHVNDKREEGGKAWWQELQKNMACHKKKINMKEEMATKEDMDPLFPSLRYTGCARNGCR